MLFLYKFVTKICISLWGYSKRTTSRSVKLHQQLTRLIQLCLWVENILMFQELQKYCVSLFIAHLHSHLCPCHCPLLWVCLLPSPLLSAFGPSAPHLLHLPLGWVLFSSYSLWQVGRSGIRTVMGGGLTSSDVTTQSFWFHLAPGSNVQTFLPLHYCTIESVSCFDLNSMCFFISYVI